mgnify:FL=1
MKRPNVFLSRLSEIESVRTEPFFSKLASASPPSIRREVIEQLEIETKYDGYLQRDREQIDRRERFESSEIPEEFDYKRVKSLSTEGREKLLKVRPRSIGQASRISGVTASDVSVLMVYLHG